MVEVSKIQTQVCQLLMNDGSITGLSYLSFALNCKQPLLWDFRPSIHILAALAASACDKTSAPSAQAAGSRARFGLNDSSNRWQHVSPTSKYELWSRMTDRWVHRV